MCNVPYALTTYNKSSDWLENFYRKEWRLQQLDKPTTSETSVQKAMDSV
jgi:hypothetical protein